AYWAYSPEMVPSALSNSSSTVACPTGLRALEPAKITSVSESPRRRLAALSPITQRTASMMLDLPQPLGPTMPLRLVGRCSVVGSTKDLKPAILMVVRRMDCPVDADVPVAAAGMAVVHVRHKKGSHACAACPPPRRRGRLL